ncbi:MAG: precorrin-3B C(17)-methyltransferase [Chitinivibrionales bacterium]|nr:precorrin-3B C(17)-methyltransferase [Chitinivibrionales bacterium]
MLSGNSSAGAGKLYVVGLGPGNRAMRTFAAQAAVLDADVVVGYKSYIDLVADLIEGKVVESSGMRDERNRVMRAIDHALAGKSVALVSSGDPGVYGMAGLALESCRKRDCDVPIEIIAGVTAANSAAALLGAPLSCDYCVVSLSNLLVPSDRILRRVRAAAAADFVTVLYNPVSQKRKQLLLDTKEIFLEHRSPQTPVGIVHGIARESESAKISTLDSFVDYVKDMVTTVVIGNSQTHVWRGTILNPRGYEV